MALKNLRTGRVLVIDDKPDEAIPVLTALGNLGVGCIYVRGDRFEDLPKEPVEGVRLVFLDMRLDEGGDQKSALSKTLGVLQRCVLQNTMPLVIVCWTRHSEDVEMFREMATEICEGLSPGFIVGMEKPIGEPESWAGQLHRIQETLKDYTAVGLVWDWERVLHLAATETSQIVSEVAALLSTGEGAPIGSWEEGIFEICRELVRAEAGKCSEEETVSNALLRMINELAVDRIQHSILDSPFSCSKFLKPKNRKRLRPGHISRLNEMIVVDPVSARDRSCPPGSVFVSDESGFLQKIHKRMGFDKADLLDSLVDPSRDSRINSLHSQIRNLEGQVNETPTDERVVENLEKLRSEKKEIIADIAQGWRLVLIEISPACDYAQGNRPLLRFLGGVAVPEEDTKFAKNGEFLYKFDPMTLPSLEGNWVVVVSSRHSFSVRAPWKDMKLTATCRLRSHAISDLRTWAAFRGARPGKRSL